MPTTDESDRIADVIQAIIDREFISLRVTPARSDPYIEGFRNALEKRMAGRDRPNVYQPGTSASDAYLAGKAEGREFPLPDISTPTSTTVTA